jgi:hypothetical protein
MKLEKIKTLMRKHGLKKVPRDKGSMSACHLGPREGSIEEVEIRDERIASETVKSERGSIPFPSSLCILSSLVTCT